MDDEFVLVTCPNGYAYGSTCSLACFMSYELDGDANVTCERNTTAEDKAFWNWSNETQAFCQKLCKLGKLVCLLIMYRLYMNNHFYRFFFFNSSCSVLPYVNHHSAQLKANEWVMM